jgi:hypothetical protein
VHASVIQQDDEGNVRWDITRSTVLPVGIVVEEIRKQLAEQLGGGVAVTVDCGAGPFLGGSAGAKFECTATTPGAEPLALAVTQDGDLLNFSWEVKAEEGGLAAVVHGATGQSPPTENAQP